MPGALSCATWEQFATVLDVRAYCFSLRFFASVLRFGSSLRFFASVLRVADDLFVVRRLDGVDVAYCMCPPQLALRDAFLDARALSTLHDRYGISTNVMATRIKK